MWAWLLACDEPGRGVQDAEPVACLAPPADTEWDGGVVEGRASGDSAELDGDWVAGDRCADRARVLQVEDDDGETWSLGYGWTEEGFDATRPMDLGPGDEVQITFATDGVASGFVVRQGPRIVAALEVGTGAPALPADEIPSFGVADGRTAGSASDECGRFRSRRIEFTGDRSVELEPVDFDRLYVDGQELEVWALANTAFRGATCPILGRKAWALWRTE